MFYYKAFTEADNKLAGGQEAVTGGTDRLAEQRLKYEKK
jgi:hypothetical protein